MSPEAETFNEQDLFYRKKFFHCYNGRERQRENLVEHFELRKLWAKVKAPREEQPNDRNIA
jgi:hypothetical protein